MHGARACKAQEDVKTHAHPNVQGHRNRMPPKGDTRQTRTRAHFIYHAVHVHCHIRPRLVRVPG